MPESHSPPQLVQVASGTSRLQGSAHVHATGLAGAGIATLAAGAGTDSTSGSFGFGGPASADVVVAAAGTTRATGRGSVHAEKSNTRTTDGIERDIVPPAEW